MHLEPQLGYTLWIDFLEMGFVQKKAPAQIDPLSQQDNPSHPAKVNTSLNILLTTKFPFSYTHLSHNGIQY